MDRTRSSVRMRLGACLLIFGVAAALLVVTPNGVLSLHSFQAHAHPMISPSYSGSSVSSGARRDGSVSAFSTDVQTHPFSRPTSLDCSRHASALTSPKSSTQTFTLVDALNLHALARSSATPDRGPDCERLFASACANPDSIVAMYARIAGLVAACSTQPFIDHVREAIRQFTLGKAHRDNHAPDMFDVIADSEDATVIQVQVDELTGETQGITSTPQPLSRLQPNFLRLVSERARASAILVIAPTGRSGGAASAVVAEVSAAARRANGQVDIVVRPLTGSGQRRAGDSYTRGAGRSPDDSAADVVHDVDVAFFSHARHLVVDRGVVAALFAMASSGSVYASADVGPIWQNHLWRWQLVSDLRGPFIDTSWTGAWRAVGRVEPNLCAIEHVARGDGEKFVCSNMPHISEASCWVLSLGCGGLFQFERHVVHKWNCSVALFDCTGSWSVPDDLKQSVKFAPLCVAAPGDTRDNYKSLSQLMRIGATAVGVAGESVPPVLVKLDVEGFEYPVLGDLLASTGREALPRQLVVEFHLLAPSVVGKPYEFHSNGYHKQRIRLVHALSMMGNLSNAGYATVHRADNPTDDACSELTLVRRDSLPGLAVSSQTTAIDDDTELLN